MKNIIKNQKRIISKEIWNLKDLNGNNLINIRKDLGVKILHRIIIISTWRSGSTFVGQLLSSLPGSYYFYEPLSDVDDSKILQKSEFVKKGINQIKQLMQCNFTNMEKYLNYAKNYNPFLFYYNTPLWKICENFPDICYNKIFLKNFCLLFPLQVMKILRLPLKYVENLLQENNLNIKIIYLIRDPRAIWSSRSKYDWCKLVKECGDMNKVCKDLEEDYESAKILTKKFPNNFKIIRFEELAMDPFNYTKKILNSYGIQFNSNVKRFLEEHTTYEEKNPYSTIKNSSMSAFKFMKTLTNIEIKDIETKCDVTMKLWGYKLSNNGTFDKNFILLDKLIL